MFGYLFSKRPRNVKDDLLSGLTVALALVPEAIAFAFVADLPPMVGLHAAFLVGLIAAVAGGRPGMISGATGAMAVVLLGLSAALKDQWGLAGVERQDLPTWFQAAFLEHVYLAVGIAGVIQVLCGVLRLGKFIRIVPHPVMLGFVNGLAIVICMAQFSQFKVPGTNEWLSGGSLALMLGLIVMTMAIIIYLPKLTKAVPSTLAAIVVVSLVVAFGGLDTTRVGDLASVAGDLPLFHVPGFSADLGALAAADGVDLGSLWSWATIQILLPTSLVLAAVGLIESLMTMSLIDEITETRGRGNRECVGQGLANVACGAFSAMGGCAMIGQSMININSGGRGRLSGITGAVCLLAFVLFLSGLIEQIPVAALVGVMFMVVIGTFEWSSLRLLGKVPREDVFIIVAVSAVTVFTDNLALAVGIGVIIAALVFAWQQARHIEVHHQDEDGDHRVYRLRGVLFFASVSEFRTLFNPANDPQDVVIDFVEARVADHSAIEAISALTERYAKAGKTLHLRHLSADCRGLLDRADKVVEVNHFEDPHYKVADDALA
ncbi:MAG: SulP family inorganic anion transporter [Planctomycetota bacterium]|jgi:SulP family sulfate permease